MLHELNRVLCETFHGRNRVLCETFHGWGLPGLGGRRLQGLGDRRSAEGPPKLNAGNLSDVSILERSKIVVLGNIVSKTDDPMMKQSELRSQKNQENFNVS